MSIIAKKNTVHKHSLTIKIKITSIIFMHQKNYCLTWHPWHHTTHIGMLYAITLIFMFTWFIIHALEFPSLFFTSTYFHTRHLILIWIITKFIHFLPISFYNHFGSIRTKGIFFSHSCYITHNFHIAQDFVSSFFLYFFFSARKKERFTKKEQHFMATH